MTALPITQIANLTFQKNYDFNIYFDPKTLIEVIKSFKLANCKYLQRLKFDYNITDNIISNKRGVYFFVLEFDFDCISFKYLLYIGRVVGTNNFKKRFYKYRSSIGDPSSAQNIMLLTNLWPENTYVYFFEIPSRDNTADFEKILINRLRPSFNEMYFTNRTIQSTPLY